MCCKGNISPSGIGVKLRSISFVKFGQNLLIHMIIADLIKQLNKSLIVLPVNMLQLNSNVICTLKRHASEEERRIIVFVNYFFVFVFYNRSKLLKIAYHKQLYTSKRQVPGLVSPQCRINSVECICPYHTNLINYKQVKAPDYVDLFAAHLIAGRVGLISLVAPAIFG